MDTTAARLAVAKTWKIYVGGAFPRTESGRYHALRDGQGNLIANVCRSSRKDIRNAVAAARGALARWSGASAYLRSQVLYRCAEMLEARREQFATELAMQEVPPEEARREVESAIDRLVYYAGWGDKYQQIFSAVNPVNSSHFNFSMLEPTGVVTVLAPRRPGLLGLVSNLAPAVIGGNTVVLLASEELPLSAVSFAEVLHDSDVPAGVVNILTGFHDELAVQFASHMDVNALVCTEGDADALGRLQEEAAGNLKRVLRRVGVDWAGPAAQNPYLILDTQETKTTWHPVGG